MANKKRIKRGVVAHRLYQRWASMKDRCNNPNHKNYHQYGGRGITVDSRWYVFKNFANDMFPTFKEGLTVERIDNDGPYSKENCRWATRLEQANNTRQNTTITWNGQTMSISSWERKLGISSQSLLSRLYKHGWSKERAFTQPFRKSKRNFSDRELQRIKERRKDGETIVSIAKSFKVDAARISRLLTSMGK